MIDSDEGLKDRDEVLEEMRSLFRYEDELLKGNWYSETDFVGRSSSSCKRTTGYFDTK